MKKLPFIIFALLLIGCSDNGVGVEPEPGFEPYRVGTWEIISPTEAEWIGKESSQKQLSKALADTIELKQPGNRSLEVWKPHNTVDARFKMAFIDSSVTVDDHREHDIQLPILDNPKAGSNYPLRAGSAQNIFTEDRLKTELDMVFLCSNDFDKKSPIIQLIYKKADKSVFRVYNIHVDGIIDAVSEIVPC